MRLVKSLAAAALILGAVGCASTEFESTWKKPGAGPGEIQGSKVIVIALAPTAARRPAEDVAASKLAAYGSEAKQSYNILPEGMSKEDAIQKMKAEGFQAAFVMKVTGSDKQLSSTPGYYYGAAGPAYRGFYGGGWGWGAYSPPEIRTDTLVSVETLVYSLKTDELVWAGRSKTMNPSKLDAFVSEVVDGAISEMAKSGLLKASK